MAYGYGQPIGSHLLVIAASRGDMLAETLAVEFQRLGWTPIITEQVEQHASAAQACVVLISPGTQQSPAVLSALAARPSNLIALLTTPMAPPYAPWAVAPMTISGSPAQTCAAVNRTLVALLGPAAPPQALSGYPPTSSGVSSYSASTFTNSTYGSPAFGSPGFPEQYGNEGAPAPARRNRSFLFAAIGGFTLLACVIASLFGLRLAQSASTAGRVSAQATATAPLATPTLARGYARYADPTGYYQINVPTNWVKSDQTGYPLWLAPTHVGVFGIQRTAGDASATEIGYAEPAAFASYARGNGGTYSNLQGPSTVSLAGEQWQQETADITVKGVMIHGTVLAVEHEHALYMIICLAQAKTYTATDQQVFEPVIHSFYFLL